MAHLQLTPLAAGGGRGGADEMEEVALLGPESYDEEAAAAPGPEEEEGCGGAGAGHGHDVLRLHRRRRGRRLRPPWRGRVAVSLLQSRARVVFDPALAKVTPPRRDPFPSLSRVARARAGL